ncbi:MAG TPA: hypothetical protein VLM89_15835 [Phycisphaerae bacterium]|nr:hypothetical protein [Phycisphaerae bacterium]
MRRSFILAGLMLSQLVLAAGCDGTKLAPIRFHRFKIVSVPMGSETPPTSQPAQAETVADTSARPSLEGEAAASESNPAINRLNEAVDKFVARFPPADPAQVPQEVTEGEASRVAESQARAATQPAIATAEPRQTAPPAAETPTARIQPTPSAPPMTVATTSELPSAPVGYGDAEIQGPTPSGGTGANTSVQVETAASPEPPGGPQPAGLTAPRPQVEIVDIRPAAEDTPRSDPPTAAPNQAVEKTPTPGHGDISRMIAQLEETVRRHPQQMDDQIKLRLLYLATGQKQRATAPLKEVDAVQGEVLSALFRTIAGTHEALRDPAQASGPVIEAVADLQRLLSGQSPVIIQKMVLVTAVNSFGDYKAVQPPLFPAGRPVHVFCYCEIGNFHSEPTQDGRLRTVLAATAEVFDSTGKIVWQQKVPQIEDLVHTPRRDFFIPLEIKLPDTLGAGEYVAKVGIEDKLGATADQQRLTFTIGK